MAVNLTQSRPGDTRDIVIPFSPLFFFYEVLSDFSFPRNPCVMTSRRRS